MKKYIVKMMNKDILIITEKEFKNLEGKSGTVYVPSIDAIFNINSICSILPEDSPLLDINPQEGILSDGREVIKKFGNWVLLDNPNIILNSSYFPDIKPKIKSDIEKIGKLIENYKLPNFNKIDN